MTTFYHLELPYSDKLQPEFHIGFVTAQSKSSCYLRASQHITFPSPRTVYSPTSLSPPISIQTRRSLTHQTVTPLHQTLTNKSRDQEAAKRIIFQYKLHSFVNLRNPRNLQTIHLDPLLPTLHCLDFALQGLRFQSWWAVGLFVDPNFVHFFRWRCVCGWLIRISIMLCCWISKLLRVLVWIIDWCNLSYCRFFLGRICTLCFFRVRALKCWVM